MRETGYSRRNLGLTGSAKNATSPTNLAVILRQPPRLKIRADNRRFRNLGVPVNRSCVARWRSLRLPLPFDEEICCLAVFLCETGDSVPNPCLDGRAES